MPRYLTEFLGAGFLVLVIALAVQGNVTLAPIPIGIALMCLVYMGGHISGAHYNPAVTVALVLRGATPAKELVPYIVSQCLGALAAAAIAKWMVPGHLVPGPGDLLRDGIVVGKHPMSTVFVGEVLFTFLLALTVLQVASHKAVKGNSFYGFAIGGVVLVAAFVIGPVTSCVLNPAVAVGGIGVDVLSGGDSLGHLWIYLAAPTLGGVLAAVVFRLQGGE